MADIDGKKIALFITLRQEEGREKDYLLSVVPRGESLFAGVYNFPDMKAQTFSVQAKRGLQINVEIEASMISFG